MTATLIMLGLKSLLVAALALGALRLTRSRSAAERSTIAHLGLFALVALPLASLLLPPLSIAVPKTMSAPVSYVEAAPAALPANLPPAAEPALAPAPIHKSVAPLVETPSIAERAADLARYAYLLPAAALLLLTLIALVRLIGLRSRAQVVIDAHWLGALGRAQHRMGFKNGTALLTSADLRSPISWGLLRPTILVNDSALAASDQAEAIIAHELAHVIQLDWAKLMLSRIATAVFWFNPLAWVLAREAHQLREEAADDAVLASDVAGTDYAQLLVGIARHENRGLLLGAHGVAPAKNSLRRRVARVLDKTPARGPSGRSWVAGFTAGMMVMAAPLAAVSLVPARAQDEPAKQVASLTPPPETSWSTRAGEGPNQTQSPTAVRQGNRDVRNALASAVYGLHDNPAGMAAAAPADVEAPEVNAVPDMSAFVDSWTNYGRAIGDRVQRAFAAAPANPANPAAPAVVVPPMPNLPSRANFDFGAYARQWRNSHNGKGWSQADTEVMMGVTPEYRKDMADAGFANATSQELIQARAWGLTGQYIQDMRKAGITGSLSTYGQARAHGLFAATVDSLRSAGINGSLNDYIRARDMGLTGGYVQSLKDAGFNGTLNDYIEAKTFGISGGYVRALKGVGVTGSASDYQQMRDAGVNSRFVRALHDKGNPTTNPRKLIELVSSGYNPYYSRDGDP